VTAKHVRWPQVIGSDPEVTSFDQKHLEVGVEGRKLTNTVRLTSYKTVACRRRQSRDWKWRHVTSGVREWPGSDVISPEVTESGCRRPKTGVYCAFDFLWGCSSLEEVVTWQKMTSHDLRWPEVTRKRHHLTGSHLETVVDRKLEYTVRLTSYNAVHRRRRQLRGRKCHVISGDPKLCHLTGSHLEVAVEGQIMAYNVRFTPYKVVAR